MKPGGTKRVALLCLLAMSVACERSRESSPVEVPPRVEVHQGGTERPAELVIGMTPYLGEDKLRREFEPLFAYLGRAVGLPTRLRVAQSYDEVTRWMLEGVVQLGVLSPFNYVHAKRVQPDLILLATHIAEGSSTYSAYIITREDSDIERVHELKGKRFGYVDENSTSGYLYPRVYLRNLGMDPDSVFSQALFAGSHTRLIDMVVAREVDAGATFSTAYKIAERKQLRILAKTGRIPYDAYCAHPSLEQGLVRELRETMLALSTRSEQGRQVLGGLTNINGFVAVGDDHYDEVRRVERLTQQERAPTP